MQRATHQQNLDEPGRPAPVRALAVAFDGKIVRARAAPEGTLRASRDASS
ncbi:hypothetical protein [Sorangium sp. So ce1335]